MKKLRHLILKNKLNLITYLIIFLTFYLDQVQSVNSDIVITLIIIAFLLLSYSAFTFIPFLTSNEHNNQKQGK